MAESNTTESPEAGKSCSIGGGFNYCRFSKTLVAIVLFPMVTWIVSYFFSCAVMKILASAIAIGALIAAAIWIDRLPILSGKIPALIGKGSKHTA